MKDRPLQTVKAFLQRQAPIEGPMLLGYSGGYDSKALLYILLACRESIPFVLHIAHVDHGWRKESKEEVLSIQEEAKHLSLPVHLHCIDSQRFASGNAELIAREERLAFFQKVYKQIGARALVLAHQKEDLSETVLKRVLEGPSLLSLKGMETISTLDGMTLWRPLLSCRKKELMCFLESKHLPAFHDLTNEDPKYLRARMRTQIFPFLEKSFGKSFGDNLVCLAEEAGSLDSYMAERIQRIERCVERGVLGALVDFTKVDPIHPFECKCFLKKFLFKEGISFSREILERMTRALIEREGNISIAYKGSTLCSLDRGILFITSHLPTPPSEQPLLTSTSVCNGWKWNFLVEEESSEPQNAQWRALFLTGKAVFYLPKGEFFLSSKLLEEKNKKNILEVLQEKKVPAFMRRCFPFVIDNKTLAYEFLSGVSRKKDAAEDCLKVVVTIERMNEL